VAVNYVGNPFASWCIEWYNFWNPYGAQDMPIRSSVRFTDDYIKSLKPTASRYELYDANLAGFGIRVSPSGAKSWMEDQKNGR